MTNLPESNFKWRRIYSYVLSCVLLLFVAFILHKLTDQEQLGNTAFWILMVLWWVITFYMVAPSAEQIARIVQAAKITLSNPFSRSKSENTPAESDKEPTPPSDDFYGDDIGPDQT